MIAELKKKRRTDIPYNFIIVSGEKKKINKNGWATLVPEAFFNIIFFIWKFATRSANEKKKK